MMKISTRGRYALRLMIDLAQHQNKEYISLKEISIRQDITVRYLEQIIAIEDYLRNVTLEDLAIQQKEAGCDYGAGI